MNDWLLFRITVERSAKYYRLLAPLAYLFILGQLMGMAFLLALAVRLAWSL